MICCSVLLENVLILEVLVTESASAGLELGICSSVYLDVVSVLEVLVTECLIVFRKLMIVEYRSGVGDLLFCAA